jgi:hypothetical protein
MPHSFHLHGTSFRVHRTDGGEPAGRLRGWKDTVLVPPGGSVDLLVRFEGPGDPDTPYMFHCHLLSHHDQGMMGQLLVLDPGQEAATSPHHDAGAGAAPRPPAADPAAAPASASEVFPDAVDAHQHP